MAVEKLRALRLNLYSSRNSLEEDVVVPALASVPASPKSVGWLRKTLKIFGPGLVTGAADDDPSGIATYSSVGAQFGYGMLWTMPIIYPFMAAVQEISAWMGRVTGRGIAGNIRLFYPAWMLYVIVFLLFNCKHYQYRSGYRRDGSRS